MEAWIGGIIRHEPHISVFVPILNALFIFIGRHRETIVIYEDIRTGIIWRVNKDHLDLTQIALLQELEDFQIVALDVEVFGGIPIDACRFIGTQRSCRRSFRWYPSLCFLPDRGAASCGWAYWPPQWQPSCLPM